MDRGGFFAGKITSATDTAPEGGRFDAKAGLLGQMYRARYLRNGYFEALPVIKAAAVCINDRWKSECVSFAIGKTQLKAY